MASRTDQELTLQRARTPRPPLPYLPGLDGIRAIAVFGVLLFHLPAQVLPGGFLGVDVFFVLSGFLITTLILEELERTKQLGFRAFYLRRARRLLPALLVVLVVTSLLVLFLARDAAVQFREDAIAAATYTTNWWYVFDEQSYFEVMGRPPLLLHLWSLAIEEQFYLVWPSVAFLSWRRWGRAGVGVVAVVGAIASTLLMALYAISADAPAAADTARIYFGSDTHAMTVLVGAALAVVWRPALLPRVIPRSAQVATTALGSTSLLLLVAFFAFVSEQSAWLYRGGFLLLAIVAMGVTMAASHPAGQFGKALGNPIMRWMGTRSYGIYLWHWPIFLVTRPDLDLSYGGMAAVATSLGLTFLAAEASYRWIEMPVRRGAVARVWASVREGTHEVKIRAVAVCATTGAVLLAVAVAVAVVPPVDSDDYLGGVTAIGAGELRTNDPERGPGGGFNQDDVPMVQRRITAVGDSVLLGARVALQTELPRMHIDAEISRQPHDTIRRIRERLKVDALASVLVVQTGTNGVPAEADLRGLFDLLDHLDRVVLINVRSPVPWMEQSNRVLAEAARGYDNVVVADWAAASAGEESYLESDGTHLTPRGAAVYAHTVAEALS